MSHFVQKVKISYDLELERGTDRLRNAAEEWKEKEVKTGYR